MWLIEFQQQKEIPDYLKTKSGLASQVLFVTFFALLFINIYKPFKSENWASLDSLQYIGWSLAVVFVGFFVLVVSRTILYHYAKKHRMFYWVYALWIIIEISAMALIYTLVVRFFMPEMHIDDGTKSVDFFWGAFFIIFFVLLIPMTLSWLYFAFSKKKHDLQLLQSQIQGGQAPVADQPSVLLFKDEKGEVKFSVKSEYVLWIEAADNYVIIKYQNQGKISDFMLRNSLKHLTEDLQGSSLFRCHRSYMVNFDHAVSLRKGTDGLVIELDIQPLKEIPVSKTYREETSQAFMQYTYRKS